ncbi:hypothetical protein CRENBAI_004140 [Crenichthys baileyi]|uniref:Uncharacterized protein n=1 Tax=Crenichthys baileyi TaxID=28760 RepID=A0AAV9QPE6_9TELE
MKFNHLLFFLMETFSQLRKNETCCMDPLNVLVQIAAAVLKRPSCYFPIMDLQFPALSSGVGLMFVLIGPALQLNMDPASNPQTELSWTENAGKHQPTRMFCTGSPAPQVNTSFAEVRV